MRRPWEGDRRAPRKTRLQKGGMSWHSTCGKTHISPGTSFTWVLIAWSLVQLSILHVHCPVLVGSFLLDIQPPDIMPPSQESALNCSPLFLPLVVREQWKPGATLLQSH